MITVCILERTVGNYSYSRTRLINVLGTGGLNSSHSSCLWFLLSWFFFCFSSIEENQKKKKEKMKMKKGHGMQIIT